MFFSLLLLVAVKELNWSDTLDRDAAQLVVECVFFTFCGLNGFQATRVEFFLQLFKLVRLRL